MNEENGIEVKPQDAGVLGINILESAQFLHRIRDSLKYVHARLVLKNH